MIAARSLPRRMLPIAFGTALVLSLSLVVGVGTGVAQDEEYPLAVATDDLGTYLTGQDGKTLYYFTKDVFTGVSACAGGCLEAWPAYLLGADDELTVDAAVTGVVGMVPSGDQQWVTYDGRPLYYFAQDEAAGDTTGQGLGNVWFVAMEDGSMPPNPPAITLATGTSDLGTFLTGAEGKTLYFFTNDTTPGVSTCTGECLENWPPLTVPAGNTAAGGEGVPGAVGVAPLADGSLHVTYDGRPLYYFAQDAAEGDTNGQGRGDVWYVALTDGSVPGAGS
jgi:predicted lipoprotein with Yx(FWY)xxD motif